MSSELIEIPMENIEKKIYVIRNQKVMLDYDLAEIYGYTTKTFNQQVQRNIEKFDQDFMFQLTFKEASELSRSQNVTTIQTKGIKGGRTSMPYAFTEQGIYMLMTVLKGDKAIKQSKTLIRLFKRMKDYINITTSIDFNNEILRLSNQVIDNTNSIRILEDSINKINDRFLSINPLKEVTLLNGKIVESDIAYSSIYKQAKRKIYIIDNYISLKTLINLKEIENKEIIIFTDNVSNHLTKLEYLDFIKEYPNVKIEFIKTNNLFHDRYIILDYNLSSQKVYMSGSSSKDSGKAITTIRELDNIYIFNDLIEKCLDNDLLVLV